MLLFIDTGVASLGLQIDCHRRTNTNTTSLLIFGWRKNPQMSLILILLEIKLHDSLFDLEQKSLGREIKRLIELSKFELSKTVLAQMFIT